MCEAASDRSISGDDHCHTIASASMKTASRGASLYPHETSCSRMIVALFVDHSV